LLAFGEQKKIIISGKSLLCPQAVQSKIPDESAAEKEDSCNINCFSRCLTTMAKKNRRKSSHNEL